MPRVSPSALLLLTASALSTDTMFAAAFAPRSAAPSLARNAAARVASTIRMSTTEAESSAEEKKEEKEEAKGPAVEPVPDAYEKLKMDDVVSLCKRRGIIFPSSEIYNGFAGFYDYGPLGSELKRNVKDAWWRNFVQGREDVVGLDSSIIHNPTTWKSSGHLDGFSDPMVDCKETKLRYRADQLFCAPVNLAEDGTNLGYVCVHESTDEQMMKDAKKMAKKVLKEADKKGEKIEPFLFKDLTEVDEDVMTQVPSPGSGKPTLTMPRDFNLMFQTNVGAMSDASSVAYLRPETAQGIFINFKNAQGTSRAKVPFGIAQIGKAFRNEITPRNFIFRSREFEQMEVEYFIPPGGEEVWKPYHEKWLEDSKNFLVSVGLRDDLMGWDVHEGDSLAHYALACTDVTFRFPFGEQELMGIAARGDFDLTQHSEGSGKALDYYCDQAKEKYIPHCIEPSLGVDRLVLALICSAYAEDIVDGEKRSYLKFHPSVAPVKVSVLPLLKNKPALVSVARELFEKLQRRWNVQWDASGAIGRRYRRADEVGTPFCITVDFDTIEKEGKTVTIRDRDTTEQIRLPMDEVIPYLSEKIDGY
eukprot:CAMPEP_0113541896 /NCGR_PEP_ID=MMETSP0015_2-20120614/9300_1 /TAXON_ID=2838 /ORGANISM="Odontella" /LENGTH=586 /DNA_ID=CAMNT_0000441881 /DNA_START=216 /DNA_END=1976 /DNA_ORIENTATION=+ /assembly_acc=CAM_ASM_000160